MNFKLPNYNLNDEQLKLLADIQFSQKSILAKFSDLNNRISELEQSQQNISFAVQQKSEHDNDSFQDKLNFKAISQHFLFKFVVTLTLSILGDGIRMNQFSKLKFKSSVIPPETPSPISDSS